MEFEQLLERKTKDAEEVIRRKLNEYATNRRDPHVETILDAMEYSVLAGGKRLRPVLMAETYEMLSSGEEREKYGATLETFMTAIEMIHTYSLVHDDLPAMDNDTLRRGKETTWKAYGESMGVLAGDALLNAAFEIIFEQLRGDLADGKAMEEPLIKRIAECGAILSGKACVDGMLGGQVADVQAEKESLPMTMDRILYIHQKKTAALMEASMMIGAVLAGADEHTVSRVEEMARQIGIAFQIQDDILDVIGNNEELGKPVGSDAENGKETYVTLKGLEASQNEVERLSVEAVAKLSMLPGDHSFMEWLIHYLINRKK